VNEATVCLEQALKVL
jgi:hypothetical protein